jgi:acetamidase/formamidase
MLPRHPIAFLFVASLFAQNRPMIPDHYYCTFSHTNPVFQRIKPGEVVVTKTLEAGGQNERNEQLSPGSNPLTGPFYIEGAEAGDTLIVRLRKVRLNRNWGYSIE